MDINTSLVYLISNLYLITFCLLFSIFFSFAQYEEWRRSDHLECDIKALGLSDSKLKQIDTIMNSDTFKNAELSLLSNKTDYRISPHLIYRYLVSVDFAENYHGSR